MKARCAICGFEGDVGDGKLHAAPIMAFFENRARYKHTPDVWICDIHDFRNSERSRPDSVTNKESL